MASGYNAKTTNDDANQLAAASVSLRGAVSTPILSEELSSTTQGEKCTCIVCKQETTTYNSHIWGYHCNFVDCNWFWDFHLSPIYLSMQSREISQRLWHVRSHYRQDPNLKRSPFLCPVENCRYKSKRWADLDRHTTAKHCNNPAKFECPEIGCKYNGEGNGFTRKDKLTAHNKAMHYGRKIPGQAMRAVKPATASTHTGASGPSNAAAEEI